MSTKFGHRISNFTVLLGQILYSENYECIFLRKDSKDLNDTYAVDAMPTNLRPKYYLIFKGESF